MHLHRLITGGMTARTIGDIGFHHFRKGMLSLDVIRIMAVVARIFLIITRVRMAGSTGDGSQPSMVQWESVLEGPSLPSVSSMA